MYKRPTSNRVRLGADAATSRALLWAGRCLLLLCAVSLGTMPVTQHLWTWDRFLHGGHDFEFGALMVLTLLSLALVVSKHCKGCVDLLFAQWAFLTFRGTDPNSIGIPPHRQLQAFRIEPVLYPASAFYSIPLQI